MTTQVQEILQDYRPSQPKLLFVVRASYKDGRKKTWFWEFFTKAAALGHAKKLGKVAYQGEPLYDIKVFESKLEFTEMELP